MVVLCDGLIRSGSTWSFNVALRLIRSVDADRKVFGFYNENPTVHLASVRPRSSHLVIKSHSLDASVHVLSRSNAIRSIYTWRHPYDAIASSLRMFGYSVEHWIGAIRNALRVWAYHRDTGTACILPYDSIMETPDACIASIAHYLGLQVEPEQLLQITEATSIEQARSLSLRIRTLEPSRVVETNGYVFDRQTLLHQNHIQDGRPGYGLQFLNLQQISAIDRALCEEGFDFLAGHQSKTAFNQQVALEHFTTTHG